MRNDPWLDKWIPLLKQKSANGFILELGCGWGWDTLELLNAGCTVIAADLSIENLSASILTAPNVDILQLDHSQPLPFVDRSIDVIIASLSLHYFTWTVTIQIAAELKRCLKTNGILLARFNSTNDVNYGASTMEPPIEPNLYFLGTMTKRFFDETAVRTMFQGWKIQFLDENITHRFGRPKSVWELMAVFPVKEDSL